MTVEPARERVVLDGAPACTFCQTHTICQYTGHRSRQGLRGRGLIALARHWAALLSDTVAIGTSGGPPKATADFGPPATPAFAQLRTALPWQYGSGVPSARVVAVPADLRRRLREAAFRVP